MRGFYFERSALLHGRESNEPAGDASSPDCHTDLHPGCRGWALCARTGDGSNRANGGGCNEKPRPLLFTAFGSQFWVLNPLRPMAELSPQIFTYALAPYESWHQQAWAGAVLLIFVVFVLNLVARLALARRGQPLKDRKKSAAWN